jgi:Zn-dependent protease with chaperone function
MSNIKISCAFCEHKNTIKNSSLLDLKTNLSCAACDKYLLTFYDKPLENLSAQAFTHKLDQQMLEALKKIPGIESALKTLLRHSLELSMRLHHQGNFIQVSLKQLKSLYKYLEQAALILDIKDLPELYVMQDARANAYTFGVQKCSIAISSACLDLMSPQEIMGILAHELGHIKANHVLYKTATRVLSSAADAIAQKTLGIGSALLMPIKLALLRWDRASELSSDRAALLVVKNPQIVLSTLMKLAGGSHNFARELDIKAFIAQAERYEQTQEEGPFGTYLALMDSMFTTHPFPIWRARELINWVSSGEYFVILQGNYAKNNSSKNSDTLSLDGFLSWLKDK